jgi:hypothetical protein
MPQQELLRRAIDALEAAGIPYMLTGSLASSLQGEPRATHDIDLVVAIPAAAAEPLAAAFAPPDYYLDQQPILDAVAHRGMFNLLETGTGDKVDFRVLTDEPFDQMRFARRETQDIAGVRLHVSRPEDTILMKLRWAQMSGGSQKQFIDALRVYEVQFRRLDLRYLEQWAERLGVVDLWRQLRQEAKVAPPPTTLDDPSAQM